MDRKKAPGTERNVGACETAHGKRRSDPAVRGGVPLVTYDKSHNSAHARGIDGAAGRYATIVKEVLFPSAAGTGNGVYTGVFHEDERSADFAENNFGKDEVGQLQRKKRALLFLSTCHV